MKKKWKETERKMKANLTRRINENRVKVMRKKNER